MHALRMFLCVFFLSCCFDCVLFVASKGLNAQYSKTIFEQQRYFNYRASWFLVLLSHILCYFLKLILSMYNTIHNTKEHMNTSLMIELKNIFVGCGKRFWSHLDIVKLDRRKKKWKKTNKI